MYIKWHFNFAVVNRNRRHVGPHDGGGIQRVISTGMGSPLHHFTVHNCV